MRDSVNGCCSEMRTQCRERWKRPFYLLKTRLERSIWTLSSASCLGKFPIFFFGDGVFSKIWLKTRLERPTWTLPSAPYLGKFPVFFLGDGAFSKIWLERPKLTSSLMTGFGTFYISSPRCALTRFLLAHVFGLYK